MNRKDDFAVDLVSLVGFPPVEIVDIIAAFGVIGVLRSHPFEQCHDSVLHTLCHFGIHFDHDLLDVK